MRSLHDVASEYCAWVEGTTTISNVAEWLPRILAELIHAAFCIPRDSGADAGAENYQPRDYKEVCAALPPLPFQYYREVFDALDLEFEKEAVLGDLHDDVADIYSDLAEGLVVYHQHSSAEAERYWSQSFEYHWGRHATSALRALYCSLRHEPDEGKQELTDHHED